MPTLLCSCGKRLRLPENSSATKVRCPICAQVLKVPTAVAEEPIPEVIPVRPAPRPAESDVPEVLPVKAPRSPRRSEVRGIELTPVCRAQRNEKWVLELTEEEVRLRDAASVVVMRFDREVANLRFAFPSFWLSTKSLQILDGVKTTYDFQPDKEAIARIRSYLDAVLRQDADARRKYKRRGLTLLGFGVLWSLFACAALAFLITSGWYAQRSYRGIGLSLGAVLFGFVLLGLGLKMYQRAARLDKE